MLLNTARRSAAVLALATASVMLAGCSALGGAGGTPTPSGPPETDVMALETGDCLASGEQRRVTATVPVVDCSVEHDSEAYASLTVPGDDFPGAEAITAQAVSGCTEAFAEFVGLPYDQSALDYLYYFPTEGSWAAGDRRILCLVIDPGIRVAGSLAGVAR